MEKLSVARFVNVLLLAILAMTVAMLICHGREANVYGRDFIHFYTAASLVSSGEADRLYDQDYFRAVQQPFLRKGSGFYSMYPPMLPVIMMPLAWLPYRLAVAVWWSLQAGCFLGAGLMLERTMAIAAPWRWTALLALTTLFPVLLTFKYGHLSALILLVLVGGLTLHHRGKRLLAGSLLSLLAVKPQFALGVLIWLLLRRDWRSVGGYLVGGLLQVTVVSICLGPIVLLSYLESLPLIARMARDVRYTAVFEQSIGGMLGNLLESLGYRHQDFTGHCMFIQMLIAGCAGLLLFRIVRAPNRHTGPGSDTSSAWRYEQASAVLFMLLLTPHLLVYDLVLLAVPIIHLCSTPRWRMGVALYLSVSPIIVVVYQQIGFSVVPFLALAAVYRLSTQPVDSAKWPSRIAGEGGS